MAAAQGIAALEGVSLVDDTPPATATVDVINLCFVGHGPAFVERNAYPPSRFVEESARISEIVNDALLCMVFWLIFMTGVGY